VGFHVGSYITAVVDTEKEQAVTEALKCNLEFASEQINVSSSFSLYNISSILANPDIPLLAATYRALSIKTLIHKSHSQEID
jgi:hypothetical protein